MTNSNGLSSANDDANWSTGRRSPGHGTEDRRRSRSRSPVREDSRRDRDRGYVFVPDFHSYFYILTRCSSRRGDGDSAPNPGNNLHVSGLTTKVQNEDLERVFSTAGRVQRASVMYDPHTRESRGFGFVTMETPEEAEAAINALNATEQWGKIIGVEKVFILSDHDTIEFWTLTQALGQTFSCENSNSREIPWTT